MTAPSPGPHVDLDAIADVEEGLLPAEDSERIRAHLDSCAECGQRLADLRTTRALLTALPPEPMPTEVAVRVDTALASAGQTSPGTVVPMARRGRVWNTPAIAGVAAAVAVLVLVGAVVVGNINGHHHSSTADSASGALAKRAPAAEAATVKEWATGTDYSAQNMATKVPPLVTGTPPDSLTPSAAGGTNAAPSAPTGGSQSSVSGSTATAFTQDQLRASRAAVLACGQILAGGVATTPVAVDFARFNGKPAVVFVLPAVSHASTDLDVWVVRSTCSTSSADLFFRRVPRPTG